MAFIYIDSDISRIDPLIAVVEIIPVRITGMVVAMEVTVVFREPVVMVTVIVVPVVWTPGMPVLRIITPVPRRVPYRIVWKINKSYKRPGIYLNISCRNHVYILSV